MPFPIEALLFVFLLIIAVDIAREQDLFAAAMLTGVFSLVSAGLFVLVDAVDVAFTEAAVGAGFSTVLLLGALSLSAEREKQGSARPGPFVVVIVTGAALFYGTLDLPAYGDPAAPIHQHLGSDFLSREGAAFQAHASHGDTHGGAHGSDQGTHGAGHHGAADEPHHGGPGVGPSHGHGDSHRALSKPSGAAHTGAHPGHGDEHAGHGDGHAAHGEHHGGLVFDYDAARASAEARLGEGIPTHRGPGLQTRSSLKEAIGIQNAVTSILGSYRGYDTLGETTVIFTACIGVMLLLGGPRRRDEEAGAPEEVSAMVDGSDPETSDDGEAGA